MLEFCVNQRLISARFEIVNIMQGSMNCVAAPYFIGMYWDRLSANACILGCIIGLLVLFVTEFMIYQVRDMATEGWMGSIELLSDALGRRKTRHWTRRWALAMDLRLTGGTCDGIAAPSSSIC
jgi:Na+/proline symporter